MKLALQTVFQSMAHTRLSRQCRPDNTEMYRLPFNWGHYILDKPLDGQMDSFKNKLANLDFDTSLSLC